MNQEPPQQDRYDFHAIEQKWQKQWQETGLFHAGTKPNMPKFYGLVMFPYPSGAGLSVGHCRNYIPLDAFCRFKAMQGYNVMQPMGWDAFGQPAENEAIKRGRNPKEMVPEYAANYRRQLNITGIAYDWSREINSSSPEYYRWTQWLFLHLYKRGLAYRNSAPVNWCPTCKTVLANEEVVNGRCWRCDTLVEKRLIPQWFFKITAYAQQLLEGLPALQWPEGVKMLQANWIGRSEGAELDFEIEGANQSVRVFTTRPDTLPGATFMVLAPEHPLAEATASPQQKAEVAAYREKAQRLTEMDRQNAERTKTGVFTGAYCINPVNQQRIPVYVADYVLMGYGTGAIMAVPAHDQRDFEFARKYGIPIRLVYKTDPAQTADSLVEALPAAGTMEAFEPFRGLPPDKTTVQRVIAWLQERGMGRGVVNYRLRDWLISRQRYWGAPIPIIHCEVCGEVAVPENQLPVMLPDVERYEPAGNGESPLAGIPEFVNAPCPQCGRNARRETDTMGGSACSSWYFLRFADPNNSREAFGEEAVKYWLPVDMYAGGAEHAVGHLLYARFFTHALHDAGLLQFREPFKVYRNQGSLLAYTPGRRVAPEEAETGENDGDTPVQDWKVLRPEERDSLPEDQWVWRWTRMSKSKGNVVTPDEIAQRYGADTLRLFCLFVAPYEEDVQWSDKGVEGAHRFINRVWRIWHDLLPQYLPGWQSEAPGSAENIRALRRSLHQTIRKTAEDLENFRFNTAVAALMAFTNDLSAFRNELGSRSPSSEEARFVSEALETLTLLISPIAPHLAEEWWRKLGKTDSVYRRQWPAFDSEAAAEEKVIIVVQINGKIRERLEVPADLSGEELEQRALASIQSELQGRSIRRVITVPGKLVNVVAG